MKTIGLIGGTTWHSTVEYYRLINTLTQKRLGDHHSAQCVLYSMDFEDVMVKHWGDWNKVSLFFCSIASDLEKAGAECVLICANTPHIIAEDIMKHVRIPLLHIADATGKAIKDRKLKTVGLLGSRPTMQEDFIKKRLKDPFGIQVIVPDENQQKMIEDIIVDELGFGKITALAKQRYLSVIDTLISAGAQGIILGCTEIPLLIHQDDVEVDVFDTTYLHAKAAVDFALQQ